MQKSYFLLILFFFLISTNLKSQTNDSLRAGGEIELLSHEFKTVESKIDSIIQLAIEKKAFPGCVVYASIGDSVFFNKSYGFHTYDSVTLVNEEALYDLASITKVIAGTLALMKLYEDGLIDLDEPIGTYVDGLGKKVGGITVRMALAHQGGLYPWIPYYQRIKKKNGRYKRKSISGTMEEAYSFPISDGLFLHRDFYQQIKKMIRKSEVEQNPSYRYSGLFFYLIPEMVATLSGDSFEHYLRKHFYDPLGAGSLGFNPLGRYSLREIVPTEIDTFFRMQQIHGKVHDEGAILMKGVSSNAGLFSNAKDLAKIWELLVSDGKSDSMQLLRPQTIELFTTAQFPSVGNRRGLGFDKPLLEYDSIVSSVAREASFRSYGHTGYTGTMAWADPENDLIFIFLTNRVYPNRMSRGIYELNVRPSIHQLLYEYLGTVEIKN